MAGTDLTEIQSALAVKVIGSDSTGVEGLPVNSTSNGLMVDVQASVLPTGASTLAAQTTEQTLIGTVTETSPTTDIASSGLNGRLQRIAQRLTSLITLIPSTIDIAWFSRISDGTNTAAVKTASTAAVATDPALVVAISPNNIVPISVIDTVPANGSITALDSGTATLIGANGQNFYTGSPTVGSAAVFGLTSIESVVVQANLISASGTMVVEVSMDGGSFWFRPNVYQISTQSYTNGFTAPFMALVNVAGMTNIRVRATVSWTGNATILVKESYNSRVVTVGDSLPSGTNVIGGVTQNGTWNITNISGTVPLPTGAATSANQTTEIASLQLLDNVVGPVTPGAVATGSVLIGGQYNAVLPNLIDTQQSANQLDSSGRQIIAPLTNASVVKTQIIDTNSVLNPFRPDSQIKVAMDATTLFYDTFDLALDTTNRWNTTGTVLSTSASGQLTVSAGTTALAFSALQSQPSFQLLGNMFNQCLTILKIDSVLKTGAYRFFGLGLQAASPTVAAPILDGVGFEWDATTGVMSGVVWSSGTRTLSVSLSVSQPTDGAFHRYSVFYKTSRVYFELDNVVIGSIAYPNPTLSILPILNLVVNGASTVSPAAIFISSFAGVGDTSRTNQFISSGNFPWRKAEVDKLGNIANAQMAIAAGYYSTPVNVRQTAATAANATVWSLRNPAASTKTVYIERIYLMMDFDSGTPLGRTLQRYDLERFTTATPTAGTAITVVKMDSSDPTSAVTDVRFLDTGLTTTSVAFGTPFATLGCPATDATTTIYVREAIGFKLAPGEGICIRLNVAAVIGQGLTGEIVWSER